MHENATEAQLVVDVVRRIVEMELILGATISAKATATGELEIALELEATLAETVVTALWLMATAESTVDVGVEGLVGIK